MTQTTVIFDLDGTIINIDSAQAWLQFLQMSRLQGAEQALHACSHIMQTYDSGAMDMQSYMHAWLQPIAGLTVQQVQILSSDFVKQIIAPTIYPDALAQLHWHQNQGHNVLIISASPDLIVKPITEYLKVQQSIGIEVQIINHKISQLAIPPFSFKEGKVAAVNQWLGSISATHVDYAYSDSINDLPLLNMAKQAFCINPDSTLLHQAKTKQWQIANWSIKEPS